MSDNKVPSPQKMPEFKRIDEQQQAGNLKGTTMVDQLGRIVIPKDIRDNCGVIERQSLFVFFSKSALILKLSDVDFEDYYKAERKVDVLGRVVLPIEMRKMLNIKEGDVLSIYITGEFGKADFQIVVEKPSAD